MKTIGTRNLLRSIEKERDAQKQQIQVVSKLKYFTEYYLSYFWQMIDESLNQLFKFFIRLYKNAYWIYLINIFNKLI